MSTNQKDIQSLSISMDLSNLYKDREEFKRFMDWIFNEANRDRVRDTFNLAKYPITILYSIYKFNIALKENRPLPVLSKGARRSNTSDNDSTCMTFFT